MPIAVVIQHAMGMCHLLSVASPARPYLPRCLINDTIVEKGLLNIKYMFWFSLLIWYKTVLILRRIWREMIQMYICLHVKYLLFLRDFNETFIILTDFRNTLNYQTPWKCGQWDASCSMGTDGQTDTTKLIVVFRNFATKPKIVHGAHTEFMCFVWIPKQTATFTLYNINWYCF